ncbi:MAG: flavodoxin family protein [Candidatus Odinarchaeota archaeon]
MKRLVIYYSRTGTTKRIGEKIAASLVADLDEILDQKSRKGVIGWLRAGRDSQTDKMTEIKVQKNPNDYDMIIIGTPIWANNFTPAVRTYLTQFSLKGKKVAFFTTQGGDEPIDALAEMKEMVTESDIIATLSIKQDFVKANNYEAQLSAFLEHLR